MFRPLCTFLRGWRFVKIISWWKLKGCRPALCGGGGSLPVGHPHGLWWGRGRGRGRGRDGEGEGEGEGAPRGAQAAASHCGMFSAGTEAKAIAPHPLLPQDHWEPQVRDQAGGNAGRQPLRNSVALTTYHGGAALARGHGFESQIRYGAGESNSETQRTPTGSRL